MLELWREHNLTLITVTHSIEEAAMLGRKILLLELPPNHTAQIIDNPAMGSADFRLSGDYQAVCRLLRERMQL